MDLKEAGGLGWGSALSVPNVQEMVRKDSMNVPERYMQDPRDRPQYSSFCEAASEVPVINFSLLANGDEEERKRLDLACREWGFFQMIDHGAVEALQKMKAVVSAFFDLPFEERRKYAMAKGDLEGYGQGFLVSEQQKLEWCDLMFLTALPQNKRQLRYWPLVIPGFSSASEICSNVEFTSNREAFEHYSEEMCKLNQAILANLSVLMGLEEDSLKKLSGDMIQGIRMNYYPPCLRPDAVLGVSPHSDGSTLTFLIQDDEINGLQIRHNGGWVPVKPIPKAVVVNVGDVLEVWSNGVYKSIEHRAITNEIEARISIATFMTPANEVEIGPVETMIDKLNRPPMYKSIKYIDYVRSKLSNRLDGKSSVESLKV